MEERKLKNLILIIGVAMIAVILVAVVFFKGGFSSKTIKAADYTVISADHAVSEQTETGTKSGDGSYMFVVSDGQDTYVVEYDKDNKKAADAYEAFLKGEDVNKKLGSVTVKEKENE